MMCLNNAPSIVSFEKEFAFCAAEVYMSLHSLSLKVLRPFCNYIFVCGRYITMLNDLVLLVKLVESVCISVCVCADTYLGIKNNANSTQPPFSPHKLYRNKVLIIHYTSSYIQCNLSVSM